MTTLEQQELEIQFNNEKQRLIYERDDLVLRLESAESTIQKLINYIKSKGLGADLVVEYDYIKTE